VDAAVALGELLAHERPPRRGRTVLAPFEHLLAAKTVLARVRLQQSGVASTVTST
jgi:hypothetical protein